MLNGLEFKKNDNHSYAMAEKVIEFVEKFVCLNKDQPIVLLDWQRDFLRAVLAENPRTRLRVINRVFLSMSRKGGKTGLMAVLIVAFMCSPISKRGTTIIASANSKDQIDELFQAVRAILENSPAIKETGLFTCHSRSIFSLEMNISFTIMGSREASAHGKSADLVIVDELSQASSGALYSTMEESSSAKENSMVIGLSTVSPKTDNPLSELINAYVQQDKTGIPTDHVAIFNWSADREIEWDSDEAIYQANPSARHWPQLYQAISRARDLARVSDAARSRYRTYRLNQTGFGDSALVNMDTWRKCIHPDGPEYHKTLKDEPVFLSLDLSRSDDLTALGLYFPAQKHLHCIGYMLESMIAEHSKTTGQPFDVWCEKGYIKKIQGPVIDYDVVANEIYEVCEHYDPLILRYDAWQIENMKSSLRRADVDVPMEPVRQGFKTFNNFILRMEALLASGEFTHSGVPPLNYCMASAITQEAANSTSGERRVLKSYHTVKIDMAIAGLMAIGDGLKERQTVMTLDDMLYGLSDEEKAKQEAEEKEQGGDLPE